MNKGHRHNPIILQRAREMRHPLTPAEAKVWATVRNSRFGFKIRRQHPIDRFIADFYCAQANLVIEIDGDTHAELDQIEYDVACTDWLNQQGYAVIRFSNEDVAKRFDAVLKEIISICQVRWVANDSKAV